MPVKNLPFTQSIQTSFLLIATHRTFPTRKNNIYRIIYTLMKTKWPPNISESNNLIAIIATIWLWLYFHVDFQSKFRNCLFLNLMVFLTSSKRRDTTFNIIGKVKHGRILVNFQRKCINWYYEITFKREIVLFKINI